MRAGYDRVSRAYRGDSLDAAEDPCYRACLSYLLPRLAIGSRILDLGCGCGVPVARDLGRDHSVTGVDLSPVQIERARTLVPGAEFLCADMTEVCLPERAFDAVVALYSIIHVPLAKQPGLIARMARWLEPGGWLVCTTGHRAWTGTEDDWLGVPGATMFWSHADEGTYARWLTDGGFGIEATRFIPEGDGGATMFMARRVAVE